MSSARATAVLADACLRLGLPLRVAPMGLAPVIPGTAVLGPVTPARHAGSVDVFLEALDGASPGDVLLVDNGGRRDEGCIGDLVVAEAKAAGLAGVVAWGAHRDSADIRRIGLPVFSLGTMPAGPTRLDRRADDALCRAWLGEHLATRDDAIAADEDGAILLPRERLAEILDVAATIAEVEGRQAEEVRQGRRLRDQLGLREFVDARSRDPGLTFRAHLRSRRAAIEE